MIRNPDDFRSQLKLFAKLADNADDAELFEILNALKTHETYGTFEDDPDLARAAKRIVVREIKTRESERAYLRAH